MLLIEWSSDKKDVTNKVLGSLMSTNIKKGRYINVESSFELSASVIKSVNYNEIIKWNWWKFE